MATETSKTPKKSEYMPIVLLGLAKQYQAAANRLIDTSTRDETRLTHRRATRCFQAFRCRCFFFFITASSSR